MNIPTIGIGNDKLNPDYIKQHVTIGKSTEQDVAAIFGEPDNKVHSEGSFSSDAWYYRKNHAGNNLLSTVGGFIPGMYQANQAASMADVHSKNSGGDVFIFGFKNGILESLHY